MSRAYALDFGGTWDKSWPYAGFSYNYQDSLIDSHIRGIV